LTADHLRVLLGGFGDDCGPAADITARASAGQLLPVTVVLPVTTFPRAPLAMPVAPLLVQLPRTVRLPVLTSLQAFSVAQVPMSENTLPVAVK
jgi:hypothetical protein